MKVVVVSDTHGRIKDFIDAISNISDIEYIIHLGDTVSDAKKIQMETHLPMFVVRGNNDYMDDNTPWTQVISLEGHKILLTHGHRERVNFGISNLVYQAKEINANMVMYGHTHVYLYGEVDGIKVLNPGSAGYDRGGEYESFVLMEVEENKINISRIGL